MNKLIIFCCALAIATISQAQVNEMEELRKQEEAYKKSQEKELEYFTQEQQAGIDELYQEYLNYEKEREELVLKFLGKNINEELKQKAEELEKEQPRDSSYLDEDEPKQVIEDLKESVEEIKQDLAKDNPKSKNTSKEQKLKNEPLTTPQEVTEVPDKQEAITANEFEKAKEVEDTELAIDSVELKKELAANRPIYIPLNKGTYRISSHFNPNRMHPTLKKRRPHKGIDLAAPEGTPIYASADGIIEISQFSKSAGNWILLNHKNGYKTKYFHLSKLAVKSNTEVKRGDLIGYVGSTGYSSGPHLHYEIRKQNVPIDPKNYFLAHLD